MTYQSPLRDMRFILEHVVDLPSISRLPGMEEFSDELAWAVLDEAAKFASGVLAPLNRVGDEQGCSLEDGRVRTPDGWKEAFEQFREGGWIGLHMPTQYGGQGLPKILAAPISEMWNSANHAFSLLRRSMPRPVRPWTWRPTHGSRIGSCRVWRAANGRARCV